MNELFSRDSVGSASRLRSCGNSASRIPVTGGHRRSGLTRRREIGGGMRTASFFLIVLLLVSACSSTNRQTREREQPKTTLLVENNNVLDMTIYVLYRSQRIRLGTVSSLSKEVLVLPDYLIFGPTSLRFIADPIGAGRSPVSEEITVSPGEQVQLIIPH